MSAGTTTMPVPCLVKKGYSRLYIDFIRYSNPTDQKSTNVRCDEDGSMCDLAMEICVSKINRRYTFFIRAVTRTISDIHLYVCL